MSTKVAIIEDDVAIAQMYRIKFETEGFEVEVEARAPMHLLEPRRFLRDEGLKGTVRFIWNIVRDRESCIFPCAVKRSLELAS